MEGNSPSSSLSFLHNQGEDLRKQDHKQTDEVSGVVLICFLCELHLQYNVSDSTHLLPSCFVHQCAGLLLQIVQCIAFIQVMIDIIECTHSLMKHSALPMVSYDRECCSPDPCACFFNDAKVHYEKQRVHPLSRCPKC